MDNMSGPVAATPQVTQPIENQTPKKKMKKKTLILTIVAGALCLAAIVATILFFVWYNKPEVVALNAVSNVYKAKNISTDGLVEVKMNSEAEGIKKVELNFDSKAANWTENNTEVSVVLTTSESKKIRLNVGEAFAKDGVFYIKISGIKKAISQLEIAEEEQAYIQAFSKSIEAADGKWWKISIPEIMKELEKQNMMEDGDSIAEAYTCIVNKVGEWNKSEEALKIYEKNQFIEVEKYTGEKIQSKYGGRLYVVKPNAEKIVSFAKDFQNSQMVDDLSDCLKKIDSESTGVSTNVTKQELKISDVKKEIEDLPEIILEISKWKHQLLRVYTEDKNDNEKTKMDLSFNYPAGAQVDMPEKSESVMKLVEVMIEDMSSLYATQQVDY